MDQQNDSGSDETEASRLADDACALLRSYIDVWCRYEALRVDPATSIEMLGPVDDALAILGGLCGARLSFTEPSMN